MRGHLHLSVSVISAKLRCSCCSRKLLVHSVLRLSLDLRSRLSDTLSLLGRLSRRGFTVMDSLVLGLLSLRKILVQSNAEHPETRGSAVLAASEVAELTALAPILLG